MQKFRSAARLRSIHRWALAPALSILLLVPDGTTALSAQSPAGEGVETIPPGAIMGEVRAASTGAPIHDVRVEARRMDGGGADAAVQRAAVTGRDCAFILENLPGGEYVIEASLLGWSPETVAPVRVARGRTVQVVAEMSPLAIPVQDLVVRADRSTSIGAALPPRKGFDSERLRDTPHLGDDVFRAIEQLPGVASTEFTAKLHLRGAGSNALDVRLDGLELVEPFHLKDLDGAIGIVDEGALRSASLRTGGVPARERTRGVGTLQLRTRGAEVTETRTSLGLSLTMARALSVGPLADGRGMWMVSARRGFLDLLVEATNRPYLAKPRYHDVMAKVEWQVTPSDRISAHALVAGDDLLHRTDDLDYRGRWNDTYAWLKWDRGANATLSVRTVVSGGLLEKRRNATLFDPPEAVTRPEAEAGSVGISDRRDVGFAAVDQDWTATLSPWLRLEWGGSLQVQQADYDYRRGDPWSGNELRTRPSLTSRIVGAHGSVHLADGDPVALTAGLRWDHQTHTGEGQASPRMNASVRLGPATTLRAGWGLYWKPQRIQELPVENGRHSFHPAELAREVSVGIEHEFGDHATATVEAYRRSVSDPVPYYLNLDMEVDVLPEVGLDRIFVDPVRGESRGFEVMLAGSNSGPITWSTSYTLASAEDRWRGEWLRKPWDQRHAFKALAAVRPGDGWLVALTERFHSGWPATDPALVHGLSEGDVAEKDVLPHVNRRTLRPYHRTDLRIARRMTPRETLLEVYVDVLNVYNRTNARSLGFTEHTVDGTKTGKEAHNPFLPRLLSLGVTWTF